MQPVRTGPDREQNQYARRPASCLDKGKADTVVALWSKATATIYYAVSYGQQPSVDLLSPCDNTITSTVFPSLFTPGLPSPASTSCPTPYHRLRRLLELTPATRQWPSTIMGCFRPAKRPHRSLEATGACAIPPAIALRATAPSRRTAHSHSFKAKKRDG